MVDAASLERELHDVGTRLAGALPKPARNPLKAADDKAMELASQDAELKAALFRFVDVVPACRSLDDLARHLTGFLGEVEEPPPPVAVAMKMRNTRAGRAALGAAAAAGVRHMAHRFIVGESPQAALGVLRDLWKDGVASSVDLLGEATVTQAEAQRYAEPLRRGARHARPRHALVAGPPAAGARRRRRAAAREPLRQGVRAHAAAARPTRPSAASATPPTACARCCAARATLGAHLHIDMESLDSRDAVLELVLELLAEQEFRDGPSRGHGPAGLPARLAGDARHGPRLGARRGRRPRAAADRPAGEGRLLGPRDRGGGAARLGRAGVRGQGRLRPQLRGADAAAARRRSAGGSGVRVAIASHNLRSIAHAIAYNRLTGGDDLDLELQVLRGLGDPLQAAIAAQGLRVRAYCPVGDLVAGMAYLVRRLLENTSNDSFLADQARGVAARGAAGGAMKPFRNEPVLELRRAPVRAQLADALAAHDARPPLRVPVWVGDGRARGRRARLDRSRRTPSGVVAQAAAATPDEVDAALEARAARTPRVGPAHGGRACRGAPARRAVAARAAARGGRAGGARVREAVARGGRRRLRGDRLPRVLRARRGRAGGGRPSCCRCRASATACSWRPRGVVAVISPWNFPVAIPCGMTAAGLATGNAVVLKPAEQAPGCAYVLVRALREAGRAAGRARAAARRGRRRRRAGARPARAHDRLHGLEQGRAGDHPQRGGDARRARSTSSAWWRRWAARTA